jgi:uncharacterized membrane protein YkoI
MLNKNAVTTLAAVAAAGLGGSAIAGAAQGTGSDNGSSSSSGSSTSRTAPAQPDETPLTGETAAKVKAAALSKMEGIVLRVETDEGGAYEAHVRKADGTELEVKVDKSFAVTAVQERGRGGGRPDGRGPGGGRGGGEQALTGETAAKVKAAALAKVDGTVLRVENDRGGIYEAHVRKADGTEVEVKVDKAFAVTAVEEHQAPPRR